MIIDLLGLMIYASLQNKFYPQNFTEQEKLHLKFQLQHYELDIYQDPDLQNVSIISELWQVLEKTKKSMIYPIVDGLIRFVLILSVSTTTIKSCIFNREVD